MHQALEAATQNPEAVGDVPSRGGGPGYAVFAEPVLPRELGRFRLLRRIGSGGMGTVYEARDTERDCPVAVKMIRAHHFSSKQEHSRFRREAEATARLEHPHIVPVHETGEMDGQPFLVMRLIDGHTLADRLREGRLSAEEAVRIIAVVAAAVHHAHVAGVLHRDLKPSNILLDSTGKAWLTDFGMARFTDGEPTHTVTATGMQIGTPHYMSPEQAAGMPREVGPWSDVWALGVMLYQMLTGKVPYAAETNIAIMHQVVSAPPPRLEPANRRELDLAVLIERCLQKDRARRLADAGFLAAELERWLAGEPIRSRTLGPLEKVWHRMRCRPAAAALVLVLIGVSVTVSCWPSLMVKEVKNDLYVEAMVQSPEGVDSSFFGRSVALEGDTLTVGAPLDGNGKLQVYGRKEGRWTRQATLTSPLQGGTADEFGRAVALHGGVLVVGAHLEDEKVRDAGAAHVFLREGEAWRHVARLQAENPRSVDGFGRSVSVQGDTIVIGCRLEDAGGLRDAGAAYVFVREGTEPRWKLQARLTAPEMTPGALFGMSVCVEGDTLLVGADGEGVLPVPDYPKNRQQPSIGAAYVFTRNGGVWTLESRLGPAPGCGGCFGYSVALSGDTAVIGSYRDNGSVPGIDPAPDMAAREAGAAFVFVRAGGKWSQQAMLKPHNNAAGNRFGFDVDVQGHTVLIGAYAENSSATGINSVADNNSLETGAAYVFERDGFQWSQTAYLKSAILAPLDHFGIALAMDDQTFVVGTCGNDREPFGHGMVWTFRRR
jgi:hypothetical protein